MMASDRIRDERFAAAAVVFSIYTVAMLVLERRMRATGGPGIIPFELAGNASRAETIMARWGSAGQRVARLSLWLDFGYMTTYSTLTALLVNRARRRCGHPAALTAMVLVAVAADATEGVSLLKVLNHTRVGLHARRAQIAALIKFAILGGTLGYLAAGKKHTAELSKRIEWRTS
jgi:membrane protein implicated in regulation of membrane protease activity